MTSLKKIGKLLIAAQRIEERLPPSGKLKLAKKRLQRVANIDDDMVEEIKKKTLNEKLEEAKQDVVTKFELLQDMKSKFEDDTENDTLREEVDRKRNDLEFAVENLARVQKEIVGGDPLADDIALGKKAGVDNPQEYGTKKEVQKDKTNVSDSTMDDKTNEKRIKERSKEDDERHVL